MIKKFNEYNLTESNSTQDKIDKFYTSMINIVNYDEDEYEEGDEPSMGDLFELVGDLMDNMNMSTEDLQSVVDRYPNDSDVERFVKDEIEYEIKEKEKRKIN